MFQLMVCSDLTRPNVSKSPYHPLTLRPRIALQVFLAMAAAKTLSYAGGSVQTGDELVASEATNRSVHTGSR